jgi:endonuclease/exonuclease/phosphatase (EEP) superfamily protein YafD
VPTFNALVWAFSLPLIALTLLPLIQSPRWWIRLWDYPRLQLAAALALALIAQGLFVWADEFRFEATHAGLAFATACALAWQVFSIWPYTPAHREQSLPAHEHSKDDDSISVMVSNVLQDNRNASGLMDIVDENRPDILIAVETNAWWDSQLQPLREHYPYFVRVPQENTYGMLVFSRLELRDICVRALVADDIPSVRATVRLRSGREIELYAVHPEPPLPQQDVEERDAELLMVARELKERGRPALVAGDLNDVAWSHTTRLFQRLSGLLDPRVGRGLFATFHTRHWLVRWPLDHLFHDRRFRLKDLRVLRAYGSDHFPIFASLVFDPEAAKEAPKPQPKHDDREEAQEKISEGKAAGAQKATCGYGSIAIHG